MPTAMVTGATGAIGRAIASGLSARGFEVVLAVRDEARGHALAVQLPHSRVEVVDVGRAASVRALASRWRGPLDVLVNNAATAPRRREQTPEGIERQLATNVLGYVWMQRALEDALQAAAKPRVVNVASYWAGDLDLGDLEFQRRPYDNGTAYRQSKQANRMLTAAWAVRWRGAGIAVHACHPGDVKSRLSHDLGFGGSQSPEQGAATPVWLASGPDHETGGYFARRARQPCPFAADRDAVEALDSAIEEIPF